MRRMRIVTFILHGDPDGDTQACTEAEYNANPRILDDHEEYVWQERLSKESAIARHDEAMDAWRNAGCPCEGCF